MGRLAAIEEFPIHIFNLAPDAATIAQLWLKSLAKEKRLSPKTLEAYGRDLGQFADFLQDHLGGSADKAELEDRKSVV